MVTESISTVITMFRGFVLQIFNEPSLQWECPYHTAPFARVLEGYILRCVSQLPKALVEELSELNTGLGEDWGI